MGSTSWLTAILTSLVFRSLGSCEGSCRYLPGDAEWPASITWADLNMTVGGRLVQTVPLASICHGLSYNEEQCKTLQESWYETLTHESSPSSFMMPWLQNSSCNPFTAVTESCQLGSLVSYSINVSQASDAVAGLQFAEQNNIRLVIKNTGHDYLGKSTGQGALGLWTHSLKSSEFIEKYQSTFYTGPAFHFGAGIPAYDAYYAADALGYRVVGGECPTVGIAGGYSQGGGHSLLSSIYGLGADQILEWEVVTAQGQHLIATPNSNADLYWALSGGGGGTYGVVLSMTVRAHPDGAVGGASLALPQAGLPNDTFWAAIEQFQSGLPQLTENGAMVIYVVQPGTFVMGSATFPGLNESEVRSQLVYLTDYLDANQISYQLNVTSSAKYIDHFQEYYGPLPEGDFSPATFLASRLVPRSLIEERGSDVIATMQSILDVPPYTALGVAMNVTTKNITDNAVLPAWRQAVVHLVAVGQWNFTGSDNMDDIEDDVTSKINPILEQMLPESGAYINEANFETTNWKDDFFGANYDRLRAIKAKYDPNDLLYATKAVGSDAWVVAEDGRLCRA